MAGHLLAALEHAAWQVPFEVLMLHCLAHQLSAGWTSSNSTAIIVGDDADDVAAVRVGAVAQVLSHMAHSALKRHGHIRTAYMSGGELSCCFTEIVRCAVGGWLGGGGIIAQAQYESKRD